MNYTPVNETERLALDMALKAGCLYHTYAPGYGPSEGAGRVRRFYKVLGRNIDGTFKVEPTDPPSN